MVASLPSSGEIFLPNGNKITAVDTEIPYDSGYNFRYRPPLNANGNSVDTFDVYALDGVTDVRSIADATLTININAVNDPPFSHTYLNQTVQSGVPATGILELKGYDIDEGDSISKYFITTLPSQGSMFQITAEGAYGSQITDVSSPVELTTTKVGYLYTGQETTVSSIGKLNDDR